MMGRGCEVNQLKCVPQRAIREVLSFSHGLAGDRL